MALKLVLNKYFKSTKVSKVMIVKLLLYLKGCKQKGFSDSTSSHLTYTYSYYVSLSKLPVGIFPAWH